MRSVFVGGSSLTAATARILLGRGDEVIIIEQDELRIDALKEELDCAFLHADGSKPAVLRETDPARTPFLFCLTGDDQSNIIASLIGRSLGFQRVITKINDPEFEHICMELGLTDVIVPSRTIGRHLAEVVAGQDPLEISAMIKGDARVFSFVTRTDHAKTLKELDLPDLTRVICIYRGDEFALPNADFALKSGDEIVLITHMRNLPALTKRWSVANSTAGAE